MAIKNSHKKSTAAVLSSVVAEMAKPSVAESTKRDADTFANGGHRYVSPFLKKHVYGRTKYCAPRKGASLTFRLAPKSSSFRFKVNFPLLGWPDAQLLHR